MIITLSRPGRCADCGAELVAGDRARWYRNGKLYGLDCHNGQGRPQAQSQAKPPLPALGGLRIVRASKVVSRHGNGSICVQVEAAGVFPRGHRPHTLSFGWLGGDTAWITPLYAHIAHDVTVPADQFRAWVKGLPVTNCRAMPVPPELWERAEAVARAVDRSIEILPLQ